MVTWHRFLTVVSMYFDKNLSVIPLSIFCEDVICLYMCHVYIYAVKVFYYKFYERLWYCKAHDSTQTVYG